METVVVPGPACPSLGPRVAQALRCPAAKVSHRAFPDGESYVRIETPLAGKHAVVVHSTGTALDLIALLQLADAAREAGRLTLVVPYFGYARQDRPFNPGEPVSARVVAEAIRAHEVILVNVHSPATLKFFKVPARSLDASPLLGEAIGGAGLKKLLLVAPDDGAEHLVRGAAGACGADRDVLEKKRVSDTRVEITPKKVPAAGRDVVIVDDMVTTGGTIAEAAKLLKKQGASSVSVACVHPVLTPGAREKLQAAGIKEFIATDTLDRPEGRVTVAGLVAGAVAGKA
ncbi:MAG: ribose-phosphate diphosphokinase [Halobacteria archaeon]